MSRISRFTIAIATCVLVAAPAPASGQIEADELGDLERRRDELTVMISDLDIRLEELDDRVEELDDSIRRAGLAIELLADDFERLVDARRGPAATRIEIAIAGYVIGDPRRNALLAEFDAIQGIDEPEQRRQFYDAVINDAVARLEEVDQQLRDLAGDVDDARSASDGLATQRAEVGAERDQVGQDRTELALELDEVISRIEQLQSLENRGIFTGVPSFNDPDRPALVVKIDNVGAALPQAGINQADVVWEEQVEGGFTRFAALFHSTAPEVVGPIRSMRTSDIELLEQLNSPLFANSGGNRVTAGMVRDSNLVDIGAAAFSDAYYRDTSRRRPANLFANSLNLWATGASEEAAEAGNPGRPFPLWTFRGSDDDPHPDAERATGVDIEFSSAQVSYEWNGSGWARSQNGSPHVDTSGTQVAPTNLIVQFTDYGVSAADQRSPHAFTVGSNPAWVLSNGTVVRGTWRRDQSTDPVQFVDGNGQPIALEAGTTWVVLAPAESATLR